MLSEEIVREVKRLLETGLYSQRTISKMTGVSRVVIHRIATGKRKDPPRRVQEEWDQDWTGKPFERCPICGSKTRLPCLACIIRKAVHREHSGKYVAQTGMTMELELQEQHRIRYEQVRAWREAQENRDFTEVPEDWPFRKRFKIKRKKANEPGTVSPDPNPCKFETVSRNSGAFPHEN